MQVDTRPLVLHVLHGFDTGGLENGVANLINHMPSERYRHAVLALTEVSDFRQRVERADVPFIALHKPPGQTAWLFNRLYSQFRTLRPAIVHSRNLAALEAQLPAWAAGVPVRIHGEHGLGLHQQGSLGLPYARVRRFYKPWVQHYTALSAALKTYLQESVRVPGEQITQICNGVDVQRFQPHPLGPQPIVGCPFDPARHWLLGSLGRMQDIKNPVLLAQAFVLAIQRAPALRARLRLVMVGDGPERARAQAVLHEAGVAALAWLPGARQDAPTLLQGLHALALPSRSEGISNAILEAMASGLPVLATAVGGNPELVQHGQTGYLVAADQAHDLAQRIVQLASDPEQAWALGRAGRMLAERCFSLDAMVAAYQRLYDAQLQRQAHVRHHRHF